MTQISRIPLPKSLEAQMFTLFRTVLADLHSEADIADLLDDLLSPTEKVMLGKRLAIAFLLDQGYDQRTIHTIMKVSVTTVNGVNYWLTHKGKGYRKAIGMVRTAQKWQGFMEKLDQTLRDIFSEKAMRQRVYGGLSAEQKPREIKL